MHKCAAGDALKFTQSYSRVQCYGICRYSLQVSEFMSMTDSLCTCKLIITSKLIDITIDIKAYVSIEIRIRK